MALDVKRGRVYLSWTSHRGELRRYRWDAPEGSHYPTWCNRFPHGGTITTAFNVLIRGLQSKPSVPLSWWRKRLNSPVLLATLAAADWPEEVPCVLCGKSIATCGDWWTIGEKGTRGHKSGPSCSMHDCRKPEVGVPS